MKKGIPLIVTILGIFMLWGCYPQGPDYIEEMDVVITKHQETYDFASKATYAMPDRIVKITGDVAEGQDPQFIPDVTAQKILAQIASNMTALGWQRVDISASPDLLLAPAAWETTTVYYYYDYWYWWYGGYYPYYPGSGYPPTTYYSSYTTGTLIMSLIDQTVVGGDGTPILQWTGAINGILTGSYDATRMNKSINKAFEQSPYLKTN
jgi:Domain of unknown function (DUF4136)